MICCRLSLGQASDTSSASERHDQRRARYQQLNRQIFAQHGDLDSIKFHVVKPNEVLTIKSQLCDLISQEIAANLQSPNPSANDLNTAISSLQGDDSFSSKWGTQGTDTPFASFFKLNGARSLAVAYVILQGGDAIPDTQPYLEFYDTMNGPWQKKAEAPTVTDFEGCTFSVAELASPLRGEAWFLAWGFPIGNPGTPVNVRLYAFDGANVRTVWKRDDLTRGTVTVSKDSVILEYDREYHSPDPNNRVREVLHVTPSGLQ
jgi:hypothetical protein